MENIIEPNNFFDFSGLSLAHPVGIQGGAYFTKIEYNKKPLYIQTTKGQSRQGFVKTGKKYYIDLMFDKNAESLINWFENLESQCQKLIFDKRDTWFQNTLEESDIESAFNSSIRVYKSGKFYLLRTNIKNNHNNTPSIKIFNEQEISLTMEDVTPETNFISILEIQGIKFTTRNFQIEIEVKQVMLLDNNPIFDNCLIKMTKPVKNTETLIDLDENLNNKNDFLDENHDTNINFQNVDNVENEDNKIEDIKDIKDIKDIEDIKDIKDIKEEDNLEELNDLVPFEITLPEEKEEIISLEFEDLEKNIEENTYNISQVNNNDKELSLENNLETIQLKKPNQVYFDLYKKARSKAKIAKKNAIIAYLEAKNIKKTYMLETLIDSDSDFDAEIDEVSESELEDF
jgi:hypothetical protein